MLDSVKYIHEHTDWEIFIICSYEEGFAASLPDYIRYCPIDMKRGVGVDGLKVIRQMEEIFIREKFDMVQYSTPNAAFYASIAARKAKIPVRNYHLMGLRYLGASGAGRAVLKRIERYACSNSTSIECVSESNRQLGINEGLFPPDKAVVVWNGSTGGVNLHRFDYEMRYLWRKEIRDSLHLKENDFVFGFVGRITRDKGVNERLEAFFELDNGSKLLFVGKIENEKTLDPVLMGKAKASTNVIFHEIVTEIERYYAAMDVLLLPSYREGFGNVVIEAAAVGTPSIVSDIPGPTDAVIRDKTAFVVEPKDVRSLKEAMHRMKESDHKSIGQAAYAYVKSHFDSDILCEKILERKLALLSSNS